MPAILRKCLQHVSKPLAGPNFPVRVSFLAKRSVEVTLPHLGAVLGVWSKPPVGGMVSANEKHSTGAFHLVFDLVAQPVVEGMSTRMLDIEYNTHVQKLR